MSRAALPLSGAAAALLWHHKHLPEALRVVQSLIVKELMYHQ